MTLKHLIEWSVFYALASVFCYLIADADPPNYRWLGWFWYGTVQLIMFVFTFLGWFLLIPFCLFWRTTTNAAAKSVKDGRIIDAWAWKLFNYVYGNPDDGVSGQYALIGNATGQLVPYMPNAPAWWRAYCWSGWRNTCDNLKYVFQWQNGPQALIFGKKFGWWDYYGRSLPVM